MRFVLAGGGTAGHVNPLLATADNLADQGHELVVIGTQEGLESRLVPERGHELLVIPKLPFPRKLSLAAISFPIRLLSTALGLRKTLSGMDAVIGFGGYVSAPVYLAAWLSKTPLVIHEANALPGMANKLGKRFTKYLASSFPNDGLGGEVIGVPLREEIVQASNYDIQQARVELGLDPAKPVLLVTGGSQGAKKINQVVMQSVDRFKAAGVQVYHIAGESSGEAEKISSGYVRVGYCNRMELAIKASDFAISRAGAASVSEFSALGLPALFIPYPVGNGEQKYNVAHLIEANASITVEDKNFSVEYLDSELIPILSSSKKLSDMSEQMRRFAKLDATEKLVAMAMEAANDKS